MSRPSRKRPSTRAAKSCSKCSRNRRNGPGWSARRSRWRIGAGAACPLRSTANACRPGRRTMSAARNPLLELVGIEVPIVQAPMAGVSSPAMAAAVSNAGGLGSIGVGATDAEGARAMIAAVRMRSNGPVNVNVFCHRPAQADPRRESAWIERFAPEFAKLEAPPPAGLNEIYRSFLADDEMLATLVAERPRVVSFHFGFTL